jgi:hypothetical protein
MYDLLASLVTIPVAVKPLPLRANHLLTRIFLSQFYNRLVSLVTTINSVGPLPLHANHL